MGGFAARKCIQVVRNVEKVIAIELLAACQAIEFLRPLRTTQPLEEVYKVVRSVVAPWDKDRYMSPDIHAATRLLKEEKVWQAVKLYMENYHSSQDVETRVFSPTTFTMGEERPRVAPRKRKASSISVADVNPKVAKNQKGVARVRNPANSVK